MTAQADLSDLCRCRTRVRSGLWVRSLVCGALLALIGTVAACTTTPPHYPSHTAQTYVGKPLFDLEMRWSTPSRSDQVSGGHVARWDFDQYNYAGCSVTVHTDSQDIIRTISWTRGCGPMPKKSKR